MKRITIFFTIIILIIICACKLNNSADDSSKKEKPKTGGGESTYLYWMVHDSSDGIAKIKKTDIDNTLDVTVILDNLAY